MENDLSVAHYVGISLLVILICVAIIFTIFVIAPNWDDIFGVNPNEYEILKTVNIMITKDNYNDIYDIVNSSTDITLQEKANFRKNFLMFGKGCIGYTVRDMIKEIKY